MSQTINAEQWTLFDKVMYGGLGYGAFCLPTDFFKVIIAIMFPPLGEIINIVEDTINTSFPYINLKSIKKLFEYTNLNTIIYSFLLTTLFYFPGLVYTLTNIVNKERKITYDSKGLINPINNDDNSNNTITNIATIIGEGSVDVGTTIGEGTKDVGIFIKDRGIDIGKGFENLGSLF